MFKALITEITKNPVTVAKASLGIITEEQGVKFYSGEIAKAKYREAEAMCHKFDEMGPMEKHAHVEYMATKAYEAKNPHGLLGGFISDTSNQIVSSVTGEGFKETSINKSVETFENAFAHATQNGEPFPLAEAASAAFGIVS
jgi:hypothetical protein